MKIHIALLAALFVAIGPTVSGATTPPTLVPPGVRVAGVNIGGMRPYLARRRIRKVFKHQLRVIVKHGVAWKASPYLFASSAGIGATVQHALSTKPGSRLTLPVAVHKEWVRQYVDYLDHVFSRPALDARFLGLRGLRPAVSSARYGVRVRKALMVRRIERSVAANRRTPIHLALAPVVPAKLRSSFSQPVVVIRRLSNRLYLYKGTRFWRSFGVATGQAAYPTPTGVFSILYMQRWPTWIPPASAWAAGAKPIPPGPGNPLGTRWMALSSPGVGIHGTPDDASIGYSESHGCIRMHIPDAEWLFDHVQAGTQVYIVDA